MASTHGGTPVVFAVASSGTDHFDIVRGGVPAERRLQFSFRSRAPPR